MFEEYEEKFEEYKEELILLRVGNVIFLPTEYESVVKEVTIFYTPWEGERVIKFLKYISTFPAEDIINLIVLSLGVSPEEARRLLHWIYEE